MSAKRFLREGVRHCLQAATAVFTTPRPPQGVPAAVTPFTSERRPVRTIRAMCKWIPATILNLGLRTTLAWSAQRLTPEPFAV